MIEDTKSDILIIDHDKTRADQYISKFRTHGFSLQHSKGGFHSVHLIENNKYKLVVIIGDMPDMPGMEILSLIRSVFPKDRLPIISVHETKDQEELIDFFTNGANDFLGNPKDFGKLYDMVLKVLPLEKKKKS